METGPRVGCKRLAVFLQGFRSRVFKRVCARNGGHRGRSVLPGQCRTVDIRVSLSRAHAVMYGPPAGLSHGPSAVIAGAFWFGTGRFREACAGDELFGRRREPERNFGTPERDILPFNRRGIHAYTRSRRTALASGSDGANSEPAAS